MEVDANDVIQRMSLEVAQYSQRAVVAEAGLEVARKQIEDLQKQIADMQQDKDVIPGDIEE